MCYFAVCFFKSLFPVLCIVRLHGNLNLACQEISDYIKYYCTSSITGSYNAVLRDTPGWLAPLDRDNNGLYDPNLKCLWSIVKKEITHIVVEIKEMDIQYHESCIYDFLQVNALSDK